MRQVKGYLSWLMAFIMIWTIVSPDVFAADSGKGAEAVISVESQYTKPGSTIDVELKIHNNPGILGGTIELNYDKGLTLAKAESGEAFAHLVMTKSGQLASPCRFNWDGQECKPEDIKDGTILKLTFNVDANIESGTLLNIGIKADDGEFQDSNIKPINVLTKDGVITVIDYVPGDVNGDEKINVTDVTMVRRHIVGGYDVHIIEDAANVNEDNKINSADVIYMRRYIVGGYGIELKPAPVLGCKHEKEAIVYKAPSCTEEGNIAYWYCPTCNKYFSDELAQHEINQEDTILPAMGHTEVIDAAVEPTPTKPGLTEGIHCSVCGEIIKAQEEWAYNSYIIKYNIANGDTYLKTLTIDNSENPSTIAEGASHILQPLEVEGYKFLGWYDGAGDNATQIKKIENADHSMTLYAHWESESYKIEFTTKLVEMEELRYTTKEGKSLPKPTFDGYTFAGWSDDKGKIIERIEPGTCGDIVLYENWISRRNEAWAKKKLGDPLVYDNDDTILFVYEIGDIKNVPVYEIDNFGGIMSGGVPQTVTKKYSVTTDTTLMNKYTTAVANATTDSASWTLSKDWSESISVNQKWCDEHKMTTEEAETRSKSDTGNWYVSNSKGGAYTYSDVSSTDTHDLTTTTNNEKTWEGYKETQEYGDKTTTYDNRTDGGNVHFDATIGAGGAGLHSNITAGAEGNWENKTGNDTETRENDTKSIDGTIKDSTTAIDKGTIKNHTTNSSNTSTWNSESGYGGSSTTSSSKTVSKAVSEMISNEYGYGKSYTGSNGESQGLTHSGTSSSSDEYASSVSYSTATSEETTVTYTTSNTKTGYHRWVMAGTAHVFGVVGYDVKTKSYFVYTYSMMDDERHRFEDYSYCTADFNDNQSGVIPFEVPHEIDDYVNSRVFESDGLEIDVDGTITDYNGTDSCVIIPDYKVINNKDNSSTVVKVTGLASNVFKGNQNITGVKLSRYIDSIPAYAFSGCKNLWKINGRVSAIGDHAFSGCPFLEEWDLSSYVTSLGKNAFDSAESLCIKAANSGVVKNAIDSGAKTIIIGLDCLSDSIDGATLEVPSETEAVYLNGHGKGFNNLTIKSDADETVINRVNIESSGVTPLQVTSPKIQLNQSTIKNSGICATFTADNTKLDLYGTSNLITSGPNAILCRSVDAYQSTAGLKTVLNIKGDLVTCGDITGTDYLNFTDGKIVRVDSSTFDKMLHSYTLTFKPNGGQCDTKSMEVANATPIGTLPTATRTGFDFDGWYLEDGTRVTASTVFSTGEDQTVYAGWKAKQFTANWKTSQAYSITVNRTSSPNQNADTGSISSGDTIYYGDVLSISYKANNGYSLDTTGETSITVTKDVNSDEIYATAWSDWTEWSETAVDASDNIQVESKDQHRYSDKQTTTSTSNSLSGWTQSGSSTSYGNWGAWSAWTRGSKASSDTVNVESKTVYGYYYFKCPNCGAHLHGYPTCYTWAGGCGKSNISASNAVNVFDPTPWSSASCYEFHGTGKYATDKLTAYGRLFQWSDNGVSSWAGYRYRTRSKTVTYSYYKWSAWSAWSDTSYTASDTRKVENRTVYRSRTKY